MDVLGEPSGLMAGAIGIWTTCPGLITTVAAALVVSSVVVTVWHLPLLHSSKLTVRFGTGFVTAKSNLAPSASVGSELVHQYSRAPSV